MYPNAHLDLLVWFGTCWAFWDHYRPVGTIWNHLEMFETTWDHLGPFETIKDHLEQIGTAVLSDVMYHNMIAYNIMHCCVM